jgi:hypothetical protein
LASSTCCGSTRGGAACTPGSATSGEGRGKLTSSEAATSCLRVVKNMLWARRARLGP